MLPVAIFRFSPTEGPGYFSEWLDAHAIAWQLIALDRGEPVPADARAFAGIGMMGGPMGVNDDVRWMPPLHELVRAALAVDVPVLGHCLGGQLLASVLGAPVTRTATPEIGWGEVTVTDAAAANAWFGGRKHFTTFQWHYDVFALPPGATRVLTNAFNPNQAYVLGKHIGFQCHIEMTRELVDTWRRVGAAEIAGWRDPGIQSEAEMRSDLEARVSLLSGVADDVYTQWAKGLVER